MTDGFGPLAAFPPVQVDEPRVALASEAVAARAPVTLEALFSRHGDFVWRVLRRLGLSPADAEDGMQEVFLVVGARLAGYDDRGTTRAWLFAICRNVARAQRRSSARMRPVPHEAFDDLRAPESDPEALAERRQATAAVQAFLDGVGEAYALVFYLVEVEEMTAPEAAAALGINLNTASGRLRVARQRFSAFTARRMAKETRSWR